MKRTWFVRIGKGSNMLADMSTTDWIISIGVFGMISFLIGWFADWILSKVGFGLIGNWILVFIGIFAGFYGVNAYGYEVQWYPEITLAFVTAGCCGTMLFMCILKRIVMPDQN